MERKNIIAININSVLRICKGYAPGTVSNYSRENGLFTCEIIYRLCGEVETDFDNIILKNKKDTIQFLPKGTGLHY